MDPRGDLSEIWEAEEGDAAGEDGGLDPGGAAFLQNYERAARENTETIVNFAPAPADAVRRGGGGGTAAGEPSPFVSLVEEHRRVYNRDMNARYGELADSEEYTSESASGEEEVAAEPPQARAAPQDGDGRVPAQRRRRSVLGEALEEAEEEEEESTQVQGAQRQPAQRRRKRLRRAYDTATRHECFLCSWGDRHHDGIETAHVMKMNRIIDDNYGVHANREIAREVHLYFKKEVYDAGRMTMLTTAVVLEHIEAFHSKNARLMVGELMNKRLQMLLCFENRIFREDGTWDTKGEAAYNRAEAALLRLGTIPIHKMNFSHGCSAEDLKRQSNYFNLMSPRFDQRRPAEKRRPATTTFRL